MNTNQTNNFCDIPYLWVTINVRSELYVNEPYATISCNNKTETLIDM